MEIQTPCATDCLSVRGQKSFWQVEEPMSDYWPALSKKQASYPTWSVCVCVEVCWSLFSFFLFSKETQKYPHDMRSILGLFVGGGFLTVVVGCGCCSRWRFTTHNKEKNASTNTIGESSLFFSLWLLCSSYSRTTTTGIKPGHDVLWKRFISKKTVTFFFFSVFDSFFSLLLSFFLSFFLLFSCSLVHCFFSIT